MSDANVLFVLLIAICAVIVAIAILIGLAQNDRKKRAAEEVSKMFSDLRYVATQIMIERFNDSYDLGLFDGDIYYISRSSSPFEMLRKYISVGTPSLEQSRISLQKTAHRLINGIGLDEFDTEDIEIYTETFIDELFENHEASEIFDLYMLKEEECPPECRYLIGKIDYFAIILGFLDFYAEEQNNEYLKNKVSEILEKRKSLF
jgi:hypothetical protein